MRLVVGLGNPGRRYAGTRHNVGFMAAEEFLERHGSGPLREEHGALVAGARWAGESVLVALPQSFMNLSGTPVAKLARSHRTEASDVVLLYDDADLPLGSIRVRPGGRAAGHNGVASVVEALGTEEIPRVRLGIGRPGTESPARRPGLADYVLDEFAPEEEAARKEMIRAAADAVEWLIREGVKAAMNRYNRRRPEQPATG